MVTILRKESESWPQVQTGESMTCTCNPSKWALSLLHFMRSCACLIFLHASQDKIIYLNMLSKLSLYNLLAMPATQPASLASINVSNRQPGLRPSATQVVTSSYTNLSLTSTLHPATAGQSNTLPPKQTLCNAVPNFAINHSYIYVHGIFQCWIQIVTIPL